MPIPDEQLPFIVSSTTVRITNDQLKDIATTPVVILPETSGTLDYSGEPTEFFVPVFIHCVLNTLAGAYTTNAAATDMKLKAVWGSDASTDISNRTQALSTRLTATKVSYIPLSLPWTSQIVEPSNDIESVPILLTGNLYDNAVAIYGSNGDEGAMTGGHADNYMQVTVDFKVIQIP
jgi:hypothetical protein